jgi:hypothetical protein
MTERIAPLLRWAEGYYPSRLIEPPDLAGGRANSALCSCWALHRAVVAYFSSDGTGWAKGSDNNYYLHLIRAVRPARRVHRPSAVPASPASG